MAMILQVDETLGLTPMTPTVAGEDQVETQMILEVEKDQDMIQMILATEEVQVLTQIILAIEKCPAWILMTLATGEDLNLIPTILMQDMMTKKIAKDLIWALMPMQGAGDLTWTMTLIIQSQDMTLMTLTLEASRRDQCRILMAGQGMDLVTHFLMIH